MSLAIPPGTAGLAGIFQRTELFLKQVKFSKDDGLEKKIAQHDIVYLEFIRWGTAAGLLEDDSGFLVRENVMVPKIGVQRAGDLLLDINEVLLKDAEKWLDDCKYKKSHGKFEPKLDDDEMDKVSRLVKQLAELLPELAPRQAVLCNIRRDDIRKTAQPVSMELVKKWDPMLAKAFERDPNKVPDALTTCEQKLNVQKFTTTSTTTSAVHGSATANISVTEASRAQDDAPPPYSASAIFDNPNATVLNRVNGDVTIYGGQTFFF